MASYVFKTLGYVDFGWGNGEGGARIGRAREDSGGDNIFDGFLDYATHWTSAHFRIVAFFDENLFGFGRKSNGDFLWFESFVGGCDDKIEDVN